MTKVCSIKSGCGLKKQVEEFGRDKSRKDGLSLKCKKCAREYSRERKQDRRQYYLDNKDTMNNNAKKYAEKNPERQKEINCRKAKKYYDNNKEKVLESKRKYNQTEQGKTVKRNAKAEEDYSRKNCVTIRSI